MSEDKQMPIAQQQNVVELRPERKPVFTLVDLENKLSIIYSMAQQLQRFPDQVSPAMQAAHVGNIQELLGITVKCIADLIPIDAPMPENPTVQSMLDTTKPEFYVCGVQLIENGKLQGTSLYSTIVKARTIKEKLNTRFAKLEVNHVAKIINYPVF